MWLAPGLVVLSCRAWVVQIIQNESLGQSEKERVIIVQV